MTEEAGPWTKYQSASFPPPAEEEGPWKKYQQQQTSSEEEKPRGIQTTAGGTALRAGGEMAATLPAMLAGAGVGAQMGTRAMPFLGPLAPAAPLVGTVGGALISGIAAQYGINSIEQFADTVFGTNIEKTKQAQHEQHPVAEKVGEVGGAILGPGGALANLTKLATKEGAATAAGGVGMMVGVGGATRAIQGQDVLDPKEILGDAAMGGLTGRSKLGEKFHNAGVKLAGGKVPEAVKPPSTDPKDLHEESKQTTTPEEKKDFIEKVKKIIEERKAREPLVEAVLRNKETGEIEHHGPKHDEIRKEATKDTHEQGFIDGNGQFLNRKDAWNRAVDAGQIPKDTKPTRPGESLHSGDLRNAGVKEFQVTDEQPAGQSHQPPEAQPAPQTREEHKQALNKLQTEMLSKTNEAAGHALDGRQKESLQADKEWQDLKDKYDALKASMPAVEFKSRQMPTPEELRDHLYDVGTVGQAFDKIKEAGLGTPTQAYLINALQKLGVIRDAGITFAKDKLTYKSKSGEERPAAGLYYSDQHHIELGKTAHIGILLHEAVHAGTLHAIRSGKSIGALRLKAIYEKHQRAYVDDLKKSFYKEYEDFKKLGKTDKEAEDLLVETKGKYGFTDVEEFVAEAFSNRNFQELLGSIKVDTQPAGRIKNMWDEFKDAVRRSLNLPSESRTALDEVFEAGTQTLDYSEKKWQKEKQQTSGSLPSPNRPVELDDTLPPKYLYHGTRTSSSLIDKDGNLVLRPSKNFGGKTTSISLTHDKAIAEDYASRIKGGGPSAYEFENSKVIKIHSDALPEGISRESGEEWAFNRNTPIVIPKGKFEIQEHPLSGKRLGENPDYTIKDYINDNYSSSDKEELYSSGVEPEENPIFMDGYIESAWGDHPEKIKAHYALEKNAAKERARLESISNERSSGTYKSPSVEWNTPRAGQHSDNQSQGVPSKDTGSPDKLSTPVDRSLTNPREVKDDTEMFEIAADIYKEHGETEATKFFDGWMEFKETWGKEASEVEKFTGINLRNKMATSRVIENTAKDFQKDIPNPQVRQEIALAIDKGAIGTLTGKAREVANRFVASMKDIGERAVKEGVMKGLLDHYVSHILEWNGAPPTAQQEFMKALMGTAQRDPSMKGASPTSRFTQERKHKTFEDLQAAIDKFNEGLRRAGSPWELKFKTKDISEIYKQYSLSMEKAIENKKLIDSIKTVRDVSGDFVVREVNQENPLPRGFEMAPWPQFSGLAIRSDLIDPLKFVFDAGPGDLMKSLGAVSQFAKRFNVIGSFFHAKSLMEVLSSTGIPIYTPVKEIGLAGVDKLLGTKLSGMTRALDQFRNGGMGDNVDKWIRDGRLQLEPPEDVSIGILQATGKFADEMIGKIGPKTRILESSLSTVEKYTLGVFDKVTWDFLHTGGKLMVADAYLDKARRQSAGKPFDETKARIEISRSINESFGGLNWFDVATQSQGKFKELAMKAYSPEGRRAMQIALFAPDWTISTVRSFTAALPAELNPLKWHPVEGIKGMVTPTTKSDYARLYQFKTALTYFTLLNAINMATANRPIWDNKDPTRIEFPDGTSIQAMKHAMEAYHWISDPDKTFFSKLGFIPKALIVGGSGVEYAEPFAQKLTDPSGVGRLKAVGKMMLPFQVQAANSAPPGEGAKRALMGTIGLPLLGSTAEQKKDARRERTKQLKEASRKYHEEAKRKGWE
jgi:hypothetical protein